MADIEAFKSIVKRTLDALPRLQDEAIESGDYSKVDQAHSVLDRLNNISRDIVGQRDTGMEGPTGPEGDVGPAALAEPSAVPSMLAPVNTNTPQPMAPPGPALMQPPQQPVAPVTINVAPQQQTRDISGTGPSPSGNFQAQPEGSPAYTGRPGPALLAPPVAPVKIPAGLINPMGLPQEGPTMLTTPPASTSPMPPTMNRSKALRDEMAMTGKSAAEITAPEASPQTPAITTASLAKDLHVTMMDAAKKGQLLGISPDELANIPFTDLDKLMELAKTVRPYTQDYLSDRQLSDKLLGLAEKLNTYKAVDAAAAARKPGIPTLLAPTGSSEFDEAGTGVVPPGGDLLAPELAPNKGLEQPGFGPMQGPPKPEDLVDPAKKAYGNDPKAALNDAKKIVEKVAPDYAAEFQKRVMTELGEAPKPNMLTIIGTILGGLAGNTTALKIWTDKVNAYQMGKQKIGSEVFGEAKQAKNLEAQHQRNLERDKAAGDRLDKQLGFNREKLAESTRVNNIKLNLQKRQQDINALYNQARSASAQQKAALMPLHDELNSLTRKQNDLAKMASSFAMPQEQWASQAAAVDAQIQDVLGRMAQVMQK